MRPPEYLIRSMKANPDHALVVYEFMEAASKFYKARRKLARVAKENSEVDFYFFKGTTGRLSRLQRRGDLSHSYQDPHIPEPNHMECIDPALLHIQSEPLCEDLLGNGLGDRSSILGDHGQIRSNKSLPPTDASSSSMRDIAAIGLPISTETENCSAPDTNNIATRANMQASVEDISDEGDDIITQTKQARSTTDGESMQVDIEDVNVEGDDIVPQNKQARLTGKGDPLQRAGPRKNSSFKKGNKAKLAPSSTQKKSTDLAVKKTSHQPAGSPPSMTRYYAHDQLRCLFGPDKENPEKEKTLSESDIAKILALYAKSLRPDLATFLENLSNLWRTNRFWSPDALHLSMPEELPSGSSCLRLFQYDRDLRKETAINVIRHQFVQLKLYLSFIRLCNEMTNPKSPCFKTSLNSRRIASHAINYLIKLDSSNSYSDDPLTLKDRGRFAKTNAKGKSAKINLIELEAFITYVLNTQPRVVALCHKYEQPVKDLLNNRNPALTEKEVRGTIDGLFYTVDSDGCANTPWKQINTKIDTVVSEVIGHD